MSFKPTTALENPSNLSIWGIKALIKHLHRHFKVKIFVSYFTKSNASLQLLPLLYVYIDEADTDLLHDKVLRADKLRELLQESLQHLRLA